MPRARVVRTLSHSLSLYFLGWFCSSCTASISQLVGQYHQDICVPQPEAKFPGITGKDALMRTAIWNLRIHINTLSHLSNLCFSTMVAGSLVLRICSECVPEHATWDSQSAERGYYGTINLSSCPRQQYWQNRGLNCRHSFFQIHIK